MNVDPSNQESDLPSNIGQPATRALRAAGYFKLGQLTQITQQELLKLHGVGPKAVERLGQALVAQGKSFRD
ncbi:hypothetical protein SY83_07125 [Paenibacillus swuensis]|uniref:DNA-binding protein n=1 Tax=Paenibacillus swuensis TaxID=1178515 RepID=A0A172TGK4_9BACL|nr:hypothetical protein [Paenibacillus swuensis]ANE46092.1 hypothetical protein SY83_07125 [Paenibacillus swuensis]